MHFACDRTTPPLTEPAGPCCRVDASGTAGTDMGMSNVGHQQYQQRQQQQRRVVSRDVSHTRSVTATVTTRQASGSADMAHGAGSVASAPSADHRCVHVPACDRCLVTCGVPDRLLCVVWRLPCPVSCSLRSIAAFCTATALLVSEAAAPVHPRLAMRRVQSKRLTVARTAGTALTRMAVSLPETARRLTTRLPPQPTTRRSRPLRQQSQRQRVLPPQLQWSTLRSCRPGWVA